MTDWPVGMAVVEMVSDRVLVKVTWGEGVTPREVVTAVEPTISPAAAAVGTADDADAVTTGSDVMICWMCVPPPPPPTPPMLWPPPADLT